jgi:23S rRNA (adenine2030-N6)-methyltransferase
MHKYDHRVHAGNAGDVWKHFLLLEAADFLLTPDSRLVYAESHVGRPEYALRTPGDWEGGIGKLWPILHRLRDFCYFDILADLNQQGLMRYPGSARLVQETAKRKSSMLQEEVWDIEEQVRVAWQGNPEIIFHQGDGFSGIRSLLDHSPPGLLLIDPPNIDPKDANRAEKLLEDAKRKGWIVLWWFMTGQDTIPDDNFEKYTIKFSEIGLSCGSWSGCTIALSGSDNLNEHLKRRIREFLKLMNSTEPF